MKRALRIATGIFLVVVFGTSISWILLRWPVPFRTAVVVVLAAGASAAIFARLFVHGRINDRWKFALGVGVGCVMLISAVLAIPSLQGRPTDDSQAGTSGRSASLSPSTQRSSTPEPPEPPEPPAPLTAQLTISGGDPEGCEGFDIGKSLLKSLPSRKQFNAEWAYPRGGASQSDISLIVQGVSRQAVILRRIEIIDVEFQPAVKDAVTVSTCQPEGGLQGTRYFELNFDPTHPRLISRPGPVPLDESGKHDPAVKFPFRISDSDPEFFSFTLSGPDCRCSFRLAIDWSSGNRSGQLVLDRGFSKYVVDVRQPTEELEYHHWTEQGTFEPPLSG